MHGVQTRSRRMVCANKTTEPWLPPASSICYLDGRPAKVSYFRTTSKALQPFIKAAEKPSTTPLSVVQYGANPQDSSDLVLSESIDYLLMGYIVSYSYSQQFVELKLNQTKAFNMHTRTLLKNRTRLIAHTFELKNNTRSYLCSQMFPKVQVLQVNLSFSRFQTQVVGL